MKFREVQLTPLVGNHQGGVVVGVHFMIYLAEQETVEWILNIERGGKCNKALCQDNVTNGLIRHTLALI